MLQSQEERRCTVY